MISLECSTMCAVVAQVVGSVMYVTMEFVDATALEVVDVGVLEIAYSTVMCRWGAVVNEPAFQTFRVSK
ncbi:MAG: hypothetical protein NTV56_22510 [Alphaproteobacteria bacterium]|nr:hypothetical protein [Alphaproteobacteria bacterium]